MSVACLCLASTDEHVISLSASITMESNLLSTGFPVTASHAFKWDKIEITLQHVVEMCAVGYIFVCVAF